MQDPLDYDSTPPKQKLRFVLLLIVIILLIVLLAVFLIPTFKSHTILE